MKSRCQTNRNGNYARLEGTAYPPAWEDCTLCSGTKRAFELKFARPYNGDKVERGDFYLLLELNLIVCFFYLSVCLDRYGRYT